MDVSNIKTGDGHAKDGVSNFVEDKSAELHGAINKAVDAAQPAVDRIASGAHKGVEQVSSTITGVTGSFADSTRILMNAYQQYMDAGRKYVRASPVISTAIAIAVGYGLSRLLGSRHTER